MELITLLSRENSGMRDRTLVSFIAGLRQEKSDQCRQGAMISAISPPYEARLRLVDSQG